MSYGYVQGGNAATGVSFPYQTKSGWSGSAGSGGLDFGTGQSQYDFAMQAAGMAAGAPSFGDVWNWVQGKGSQVYDHVFDWVSNNISAAPLSVFSTFSGFAPYAIPGVKFEVPVNIDSDVLALLTGSKWASGSITYSLPDSRSDYNWINPSADGFKPLNFDTEQAVKYA